MTVDFVFPEDAGTGAPGGDNVDAANFAALVHQENLASFVQNGVDLTYNSGDPSVDLSAGMLFVEDSGAQEARRPRLGIGE